MSYQNPEWSIEPAFNIFGEGTFRFVEHESFDWTDSGLSMEKLTNEGWIELSPAEAARVCSLMRKKKT